MNNEIFKIEAKEKDENDLHFIVHVTQEINAFIIWFSNYHCDGREYMVDRVLRNRDAAIIYAVERAKGVCL